MGRRKQSDELRALKGDPGHATKPKRLPPLPVAPELKMHDKATLLGGPPSFLTGAARRMWDAASPIMIRLNLLQSPDAIAFARYCQWLDRYVTLEKTTRKKKPVEVTKSREVTMERVGKTFTVLTVIDKRLMDYEDRFGMNPRERQAILAKLATGASAPPQQAQPPTAPGESVPAPVALPPGQGRGPVGFLRSKLN